ncbi:CNNM domain-containing protein [Hyphobacterium indicum]|uniref:CNNM domain-containing protein n=1 Tax=Hyphobacterium indicum TaxID=2162714 RepID=UPI000D64C8BD|nr:CNNM domain-containing protein [Hyphobacterium indicum]
MTLLILFVLLAVGVSFLCSILEAVFLSVTPAHIAALEERSPRISARIKALKLDVHRPLAAILSLNTVAHTVGATAAGAQAAHVFGDAGVGVFSAVLTLLILVVSEIIPKTLGATYWKALTPLTTRLLPPLIWSMWPLVKLSEAISWMIAHRQHDKVSREEIVAMARISQQQGVIAKNQSAIVANLLRFDALTARDIMTPRTVVEAFDETESVESVAEKLASIPFSRLPIYDEDVDTISGFVLKTDILLAALEDRLDTPLSALRRDIAHVDEADSLQALFEVLLSSNRHIAVVSDDFGGTAGVVTIEDLVETLLGLEITDEADSIEDLQALARDQWRKRASRMNTNAGEPRSKTK